MGQIKKRFNGFYKLLFSYLFILLIPVIIGAYVHYQTLNAFETEAKRTGTAMLEQTSKIVDEQLNFILGVTNRLSANTNILRFANVSLPLTDQHHYQLMQMSTELASHQYLNVYVKDILLYFKKSDTILTTRGIYHGKEEYDHFFRYGDLSYEEWSSLMTAPAYTFHEPETVHAVNGAYETVAFTAPINLGAGRQTEGAVIVYVDEARIRDLLLPLTNSVGGWAVAADTKGVPMVSTDSEGPIPVEALRALPRTNGYVDYGGEKYFVTSTVSRFSWWEYFSIIPKDAFLERLTYIRQTILWITALSLIAGALTALYLSYRHRKPLARLLQEMKKSGRIHREAGEDEFDYILNTYKNMANSHDDLKGVMEQQLPVLQNVFIEKVKRGEFKSEEETRTFAERAKLTLRGDSFLWVVIRIEKYGGAITDEIVQELQFNKFVMKNLADDLIGAGVLAHDISEDAVAFLIGAAEREGEAELEAKLRRLIYFTAEKFRFNVRCAAGSRQPGIADSWKSYYEAAGALDFAELNRITWSELLELSNEYYYPLEIENKLVQTVKAGEETALNSLLDHIADGNFRQRMLSVESKQQLIMELKGTVYKIAGQIRKDDKAFRRSIERETETLGYDDALQAFGSLSDTFRSLLFYNKQQKKEHNHELIHLMLDYVDRYFDDASLSLSTLSTHFALTENYISFLFKDRTQNNFSTYLEHLRMEKACELLSETSLSVQEIAAKVGYANDKSFRRAFKRVKGIQPTAFREQAKEHTHLQAK